MRLENKVQEQLGYCIKSSEFCVRFVHSSLNIFRDNHHFILARMDIYTKQSVIIFIFMCIVHALDINTRHNYSDGLKFDRHIYIYIFLKHLIFLHNRKENLFIYFFDTFIRNMYMF